MMNLCVTKADTYYYIAFKMKWQTISLSLFADGVLIT